MVDFVSNLAKEGVLCEMPYADDLVSISDTIEGLRNKFIKWKEAFERKAWKITFRKTKVMFSGDITRFRFSKSNVDPCGVYCLRVRTNSVL